MTRITYSEVIFENCHLSSRHEKNSYKSFVICKTEYAPSFKEIRVIKQYDLVKTLIVSCIHKKNITMKVELYELFNRLLWLQMC